MLHKHQTLVQSVTLSARHMPRTAVRSLRAVSPDRALAQLIAMHVPSAWRY